MYLPCVFIHSATCNQLAYKYTATGFQQSQRHIFHSLNSIESWEKTQQQTQHKACCNVKEYCPAEINCGPVSLKIYSTVIKQIKHLNYCKNTAFQWQRAHGSRLPCFSLSRILNPTTIHTNSSRWWHGSVVCIHSWMHHLWFPQHLASLCLPSLLKRLQGQREVPFSL